jgi:tRNA (guanine26-N2/guanine27-N2)-dimethyltransferase
VLVLCCFLNERRLSLIDGLAGTGARGIRVAVECRGDFQMVLNDRNPLACNLIRKNIKINSLGNCSVENRHLTSLLSENDFDYVDIDPFGSPVGFLDAAVQCLRNRGMLAVTATDTAPLCGTFSKACYRRYLARPLRTWYSRETGARILAGYCIRTAAKYDIMLKPALMFFADHYIRVIFDVEKGAKKADSILGEIGYVLHMPKTGERKIVNNYIHDFSERDKEIRVAGPLWTGNLHSEKLLSDMKLEGEFHSTARLSKHLSQWRNEARAPPLFYDTNEIASLTRTEPWPMDTLLEELRSKGFFGCRTHFSPTGFKTDASMEEISALVSG